jgi:hypothetical protein
MKWGAALQIGEAESFLPVATIGGSDQVEKGVVLGDWDDLPGAEHPSYWCKAVRKKYHLSDIGLTAVTHSCGPPESRSY